MTNSSFSNVRDEVMCVTNRLILSLEDIIESFEHDGRNKKSDYIKNLNKNRIEAKQHIKLFREVIDKLRELSTDNIIIAEVDKTKDYDELYLDDIITSLILNEKSEKAIDKLHEMCYKFREFLRKFRVN